MRSILAVWLLAAAAAWAQDQPAQTSAPQTTDTQQQAAPAPPQATPQQTPAAPQTPPATAPQQQAPAAPQTQPTETAPQQAPAPAPTQPTEAAPAQTTAPAPAQQPAIRRTNLSELFKGPTLSEIYCAGFISKETIKPSGTMVAGNHSPDQAQYTENGYIFLKGNDLEQGKEYLLLRHAYDPNEYQSFPGQLAALKRMGELYQDLGKAKVLYIRNKTAVAQIESSCSDVRPGDIAVPFQERPRPEFKQTTFERFAPPNGKTTGRMVMGRDFDTEIGLHRIVYLNIGEAQGVKPGDYFRITREYSSIAKNPVESIGFNAPSYDDTQKDPSKFDFRKQAGDLPRRSIGELMVINVDQNSSTALTTYMPEDARVGDGVEMIEATPFPPPAPEAVAAPEPPTISCSVSRSTIQVGESANITCNGVAEEGHSVSYSYQTNAGQITPRDSRATFTGTAPGPATITATAIDDRNLSAQTTVNIDVQAAPTPVTPTTAPTPALLNELLFKPNSARVDNKAKALLDDDALRLQREANSTMILEGSSNPSENEALANQRAENAKTYLVQSKGIDPNRIQTRTAASKTGAKVNVIMVPAGAGPQ